MLTNVKKIYGFEVVPWNDKVHFWAVPVVRETEKSFFINSEASIGLCPWRGKISKKTPNICYSPQELFGHVGKELARLLKEHRDALSRLERQNADLKSAMRNKARQNRLAGA